MGVAPAGPRRQPAGLHQSLARLLGGHLPRGGQDGLGFGWRMTPSRPLDFPGQFLTDQIAALLAGLFQAALGLLSLVHLRQPAVYISLALHPGLNGSGRG